MQALSMGIHESQSLLWERMVALSAPFAQYIMGKVQYIICKASLTNALSATCGLPTHMPDRPTVPLHA